MAHVGKYGRSAVVNLLRHNDRQIENPGNTDIDPEKKERNITVLKRGISPYSYYQQRMAKLHCMNRSDVKTLIGWVVTNPGLSGQEEAKFFRAAYDYMNELYGRENCVQCVIHRDESGQDHMHYMAIPAVKDEKHGGEKVCCNEVLTRTHLRDWHPGLQKLLDERGIKAKVETGITRRQGGNRTVKEQKAERDREREVERGRW